VENLNEEIQAIQRLITERDALDIGIQARVKRVREQVTAGKGTAGNTIRDHVIRKFGFVIEGFEATYRHLLERTAACPGQFILVVERREEGIFGRIDKDRDFLREYFYIGVLTDTPEFLMSERGYEFTTVRYMQWTDIHGDRKVIEKNLPLAWCSEPAINLGKPMELERVLLSAAPPALKQWFLKNERSRYLAPEEQSEEKLLRNFWRRAELLGRPQIPPHEREMLEKPELQSNPT
jgi:hypothetical protein